MIVACVATLRGGMSVKCVAKKGFMPDLAASRASPAEKHYTTRNIRVDNLVERFD